MNWFNKRKVTVDTKREYEGNRKYWTLIDNENCVVKSFNNSMHLIQYLYDGGFSAKSWVDQKVQNEVSEELEKRESEKFNKHFTFYLNKEIAPFVLNKLDSMDCVGSVSMRQSDIMENYIEVEYDATRQVLFQTDTEVVVKRYDDSF